MAEFKLMLLGRFVLNLLICYGIDLFVGGELKHATNFAISGTVAIVFSSLF